MRVFGDYAYETGTRGDDVIIGLRGKSDQVDGRGGDDLICTRGDPDSTLGEEIHGGPGDDRVRQGPGFGYQYGGQGDDVLHGGGDDDILAPGKATGAHDRDVADGGGGADTIRNHAAVTYLARGFSQGAGDGRDRLISIENGFTSGRLLVGDDHANDLSGAAKIEGRGACDHLYGLSREASTLIGGRGNDIIRGGTEPDTMFGGLGNDALDGDWSNSDGDVANCGPGTDSWRNAEFPIDCERESDSFSCVG